MPDLTYIGEPDRVYPSLGLEPVPGESYPLAEDPQDGRWASVSTPGDQAPAATPEPTPTPAEPAPSEPIPEPSVTTEPTTTTTED